MAFDGIVISNLTNELRTNLLGGRVSKIAMPNKDELLFTIKNNSKNHLLLISASASLPLMYLTDIKKASPLIAPAFCMLLRKHIGTAKIVGINQLGLERIVCFKFEHLDELGDLCRKRLYIELMGKYSNIIFTDDEDNIIDSIKRVSVQISSLREVLPNRKYFLPEELKKENLLNLDKESFIKVLKDSKYPLSKAIYLSFSGISPLIANEICERAGISSESLITDLSEIEFTHLYHTVELLLEEVKEGTFYPNIIYKKDEPVEFNSIKLVSYPIRGEYSSKHYDSISKLLYDYYSAKDNLVRIRSKSYELRKVVSNALERAVKKFELQQKQLKDTKKKDKYKVYGDLINTFGYELKGGEKELRCENYYDDNKEIVIPLDTKLSAKENSKKYYDKYSKLKRTDEALSLEIKKTEFDIEVLSSIMTSLDIAGSEEDLIQIREELCEYGYIKKNLTVKKVKITSKPFHYISSDGFHIYVGKNNYQNDEITFKLAVGSDWWFHAKDIPGSHVIVKAENKEITDKTFEEAASLAAYYSKARETPKVEVDYIQRKNLKKVPSGAPGFVIYHTNWSMVVKPEVKVSEV